MDIPSVGAKRPRDALNDIQVAKLPQMAAAGVPLGGYGVDVVLYRVLGVGVLAVAPLFLSCGTGRLFAGRFENSLSAKSVQAILGILSAEMIIDLYTHTTEGKKWGDVEKLFGVFSA